MKFFVVIALASVAYVSVEARPSFDDDSALVEYALEDGGNYSFFEKIGDWLEKYGKKIALIGRIIAEIGDSLVGIGQWLKKKSIGHADQRTALLAIASELLNDESATKQQKIAHRIVSSIFRETAQNKRIPDDKLESEIERRLNKVADKLIATGDHNLSEDEVDLSGHIALDILERVFN